MTFLEAFAHMLEGKKIRNKANPFIIWLAPDHKGYYIQNSISTKGCGYSLINQPFSMEMMLSHEWEIVVN